MTVLHNHYLQPRNLAEQSGRILGAHAIHIFHQLLSDGACAASVAMKHILECCSKAFEVDAVMLIEAFVFGVDECCDEIFADFVVFYRRAVLVEVFAEEFAIAAVE